MSYPSRRRAKWAALKYDMGWAPAGRFERWFFRRMSAAAKTLKLHF